MSETNRVNSITDVVNQHMGRDERYRDVLKVDPKAYDESLPEDLDIDTVKKVREHDNHFMAGFANAVGNKTHEVMEDEPDVCGMNAYMDHEVVGQVSVKYDPTPDETDSFGNALVSWKNTSDTPGGDALTSVLDRLKSTAEEKFKK